MSEINFDFFHRINGWGRFCERCGMSEIEMADGRSELCNQRPTTLERLNRLRNHFNKLHPEVYELAD